MGRDFHQIHNSGPSMGPRRLLGQLPGQGHYELRRYKSEPAVFYSAIFGIGHTFLKDNQYSHDD